MFYSSVEPQYASLLTMLWLHLEPSSKPPEGAICFIVARLRRLVARRPAYVGCQV